MVDRAALEMRCTGNCTGVRIPLSPQTTLTIKVFTQGTKKKEPIFKALLGAFLLSPLKQFAEEGGYSRKYLRLPKKEKGNRQ